MYTVAAHVMSKRVDSMNMITIDLPVAPMQKYIREHKADEHPITHMGLIVAAYLRTVAEFPALNRFIVNKRLYARNEFCAGLVVLKEGKMPTEPCRRSISSRRTMFSPFSGK